MSICKNVHASSCVLYVGILAIGQIQAEPTGGKFGEVQIQSKIVQTFSVKLESPVNALAFSHDGRFLASGSEKGSIVVWETLKGIEIFRTERGTRPFFTPDNKTLIGIVGDTVNTWDIKTGRLVHSVAKEGSLVGFDPEYRNFVAFAKGVIQVCDARSGRQIRSFRVDPMGIGIGISNRILSPDGKTIVYSTVADNSIRMHNVASGEITHTAPGHDGRINGLIFSPDGAILASLGRDRKIHLRDGQNGKILQTLSESLDPVRIAISRNRKLMAVGYAGPQGKISLRELPKGREIASWATGPGGLWQVEFNPQGTLLASATGRVVQVWEISTKKSGEK